LCSSRRFCWSTAALSPAVWYFQLENRPITAEVIAVTVLMTTGLITTALLTVYFAAARLVCRPMRRMANEMNRISRGAETLKPLPEANRGDELGMAARAFNQVVEAVHWTTRALQEANAELEKRVNERTAELASRNNQLVQAEAKYRSIFENASDGIVQTTPDGHCLVANPAMVRMLGYDNEAEVLSTVTNLANQVYADPEVREIFLDRVPVRGAGWAVRGRVAAPGRLAVSGRATPRG